MTPHNEMKKRIAERLKEARKQNNISQNRVAKILHLNRSVISKLETGYRDLTLEEAAKFSKIYNKDLSYFVTDKEPPK